MRDLLNSKLIEILNLYSKEEKYGDKLLNIQNRNINNKETIVPVLGMQGMGKSTLINSILSENILPNEADETTCVPVEVRYGEYKKAIVYFINSDKTQVINTIEDLSEYVDNNYNTGNEKGVEKIILYRPIDILKNGLVIVDLPGVGSLTKNNENTTNEYIANLSCALFVIPTVPTIRKKEEIFIRGVWEVFSNILFIQNQWGESKREVEESIDFNNKALKSISEKVKAKYDNSIIVINVYDAAHGRINNIENEIKSSNIEALLKKLENFVEENSVKIEEAFKIRLKSYIDVVKGILSNLIEESNMSKEELKNRLEENERNFRKQNMEIEDKIDDIKSYLDKTKTDINKFAKNLSTEYGGYLRKNIYNIIDGGIVDGEQLTNAFNDYQNELYMEVAEKYLDKFIEIKIELEEKLSELNKIIVDNYKTSFDALKFDNGQAFKYEKGLEIGINLAGAGGGTLAGIGLGGVIAKATILGAAAGPVGVAAGIISGVIITIAISIVGNKTKNAILSKRKQETKKQIEEYIEIFAGNIKKSIVENYKKMHEDVNQILGKYIKDRKEYYKKKKDENNKKEQENFKFEYDINKLKSDIEYLETFK